jgi:hypothetical protein
MAAVGAGVLVALWARWRLEVRDPAAWAWPMATALALAPVIYPWYLLYFTPFLFTIRTLPLLAWTFTVMPAYLVWYVPALRKPWVVPGWVEALQYASMAIGAASAWRPARRRIPERAPAEMP